MSGPEATQAAAPTLKQALSEVASQLRQAGIDDAGGDARRLAGAVLGLTSAQLLSAAQRPLHRLEADRLGRAIARRLRREPISRIVGARDFYGRSFALSAATLDPRPDSETVVSAALALAREEGWLSAPLSILDVGTGSGCLLVTLLLELPLATGVGSDISRAALGIARKNARLLAVAQRSRWIAADALEGVNGQFDIVVSNPPYIKSAEIDDLAPEVRCYDPLRALDGGSDGLAMFRRLIPGMARLVPDGWIVLEVGDGQADAVVQLLLAAHGAGAHIREFRDVAGRRRCVATRTRILRADVNIGAETP